MPLGSHHNPRAACSRQVADRALQAYVAGMDHTETVRVTWQGPTPDDGAIISAFVNNGGLEPVLDFSVDDEPGAVRVTFTYADTGSTDADTVAMDIATVAAGSLGELEKIDLEPS
jgi:hypothetical protein